MEPLYTASIKSGRRFSLHALAAPVLLAAIFSVQVYQAATRPIHSTEAYTYDRFVRPTVRQILAQELPDRDVLYTLLEKRSVGLFHVSPFSVRLPSLLFGLLFFWSIWRLGRKFRAVPGLFLLVLVALGLGSLWTGWFSSAQGDGAAVALLLCSFALNQSVKPLYLNLAGACLGLSVSASLDFAIPAGLCLLGFLVLHQRWTLWTDRILVPALVAALVFLVLPLSHAHATAENPLDRTLDGKVLQVLQASAGNKSIRIGVSPELESIVNFYRAQHRVNTWERANRNLNSGNFDYYVLSIEDSGLVEQRHLIVLYQDAGSVLARQSHDGT